MRIVTNILEAKLDASVAVALGKFDGLHKGHQRLFEEIKKQKENGLLSCVFTFDPSPAVFFGFSDGKELTTKEEKRVLFEQMGIDVLVEFPLNKETANMPAEDFVKKILVKQMNTKWVAAGFDVSFGYKGLGDEKLLRTLGEECGYGVTIIDKLEVREQVDSSTLIRKQIEEGNLEFARELLGRPYSYTGEVVHGKKLGRTIGMPTVNLTIPENKLLVPNGVYLSYVNWKGNTYPAISNLGCKPTVGEEHAIGLETYIYDFKEDLYGEKIEVALERFLRPEMRFSSVEELKDRMEQDLAEGRRIFGI